MCRVLTAAVRLPPFRYVTGYVASHFILPQSSLIQFNQARLDLSNLRLAFCFNMETAELSNFLMEVYTLRRLKNISARHVKNTWIRAI